MENTEWIKYFVSDVMGLDLCVAPTIKGVNVKSSNVIERLMEGRSWKGGGKLISEEGERRKKIR